MKNPSTTRPLLFNTVRRLKADIRIVRGNDDFLAGPGGGKSFREHALFRLVVQTTLSAVLLAAGLYILLSSKFGEDVKKIGSGFIGTVIGYWLG